MSDQLLHFNGINGDTGSYDLPPMTADELMKVVRGARPTERIASKQVSTTGASSGIVTARHITWVSILTP